MSEYPKTANLLARDETTHKLIPGEFRDYAFEQIAKWNVTEKIDGTNIRLVLDPVDGECSIRGRSDAAILPKNFIEQAVPDVDAARMLTALRAIDPDEYAQGMIVYGEGYGPGIQKGGGDLAPKKSLRIFDVLTLAEGESKPLWRSWADVSVVAASLDIGTAPVIAEGMSTADVIAYVQGRPLSVVAATEVAMEGVVCRTDPYLYDSRGSRIKFKLKAHDLA